MSLFLKICRDFFRILCAFYVMFYAYHSTPFRDTATDVLVPVESAAESATLNHDLKRAGKQYHSH